MELSRCSRWWQQQMHRFGDSEPPTPLPPPEGWLRLKRGCNGGIWRSNGVTACARGKGGGRMWNGELTIYIFTARSGAAQRGAIEKSFSRDSSRENLKSHESG